MKKSLLLVYLALPGILFAQGGYVTEDTYCGKASSFIISAPLQELADKAEAEGLEPKKEVKHNRISLTQENPNALPFGEDPAAQKNMGSRSMMPPLQNWIGLPGSGYPPDPSGAAGENHFVQAVNTSYRVYSKTGSPMSNTFNLSSLWPGSANDGDPIVLYDRYAKRWFVSQFQVNAQSVKIAISQTDDPTGSYYL